MATWPSVVLFIFTQADLPQLRFTMIAGLLALISSMIFVVASRMSDPPTIGQIRHFTFRLASTRPEAGLAWWQAYRLRSLILITLTVALLVVHW